MSFIRTIHTIYLILKKLKEKNIFINKILLFFSSILELISISFVIPIFDILTGRDNKILDTLLSNYTHLEIFVFLMILLLIFFLLKSLVVTLINYKVYKFCFKSQEKLSLKLFKSFLSESFNLEFRGILLLQFFLIKEKTL